jgi:hypothetical protein
MMSIAERLKVHNSLMETIDRRRRESGDPNLGSSIEERIIGQELRELEEDILRTAAVEQDRVAVQIAAVTVDRGETVPGRRRTAGTAPRIRSHRSRPI